MLTYGLILHNVSHMSTHETIFRYMKYISKYETILRIIHPYVHIRTYTAQYDCAHYKSICQQMKPYCNNINHKLIYETILRSVNS